VAHSSLLQYSGWVGLREKAIPFWVPMLAGILFGLGYGLLFLALLNYPTDFYEIFAASAMAVSTCTRSIAGAVLRFATTSMYRNLGVA
jgi:hypothetical protein